MGRDYTLDCGVGTMVQILSGLGAMVQIVVWCFDIGSDCGVVFGQRS